jgi:hypothetical protein
MGGIADIVDMAAYAVDAANHLICRTIGLLLAGSV